MSSSGYVTLQFLVSVIMFSSVFYGYSFTLSSTTNTTQFLQARKQIEYVNNEH